MSLRATEALLRALLVAIVVIAPMMLVASDLSFGPLVAFFAAGGALLTFVEYATPVPSIISFCAAPPYNRLRFLAFCMMFLGGSLLHLVSVQPHLAESVYTLQRTALLALSPAQLLIWVVDNADDKPAVAVLATWGSIVAVCVCTTFFLVIKNMDWPCQTTAFRQFTNFPRTADGSPVPARQFQTYANVYFLLGLSAPIFGAVLIWVSPPLATSLGSAHPMLTIWIVTAWSMAPTFLILRALAFRRIAQVIPNQNEDDEQVSAS
jgi:hypothetical protein